MRYRVDCIESTSIAGENNRNQFKKNVFYRAQNLNELPVRLVNKSNNNHTQLARSTTPFTVLVGTSTSPPASLGSECS